MENKKIIVVSIILMCIVSIVSCVYAVNNYRKNDVQDEKIQDGITFKNEYEKYNHQGDNDFSLFYELSISKTAPVKYINDEKALELLQKGTSIILIGEPTDNLTRLVVPILFECALEEKVTINYLDIKDLRDELTLGKKNIIIRSKEGSEAYMAMLPILNDYLNEYYLIDKKGEKVDTLEKRIDTPAVIAIKDGNIVGVNIGTVTTHMMANNPYQLLSDNEREELKTTYTNMISKTK